MNQNFQIDCQRKHFLKDKHYHLLLESERIRISESVNFQQSKYLLDLCFESMLFWKTEEKQLVAFGIKYNNELKWFHADPRDLQHLYDKINCHIFFGNISSIYQSKEMLGSGASSKVYRVANRLTNHEFASKCIRKDYIFKREDKERYNRLLQEINIMRQMDHEAIVKMVDIYEGEKSYYIILELLLGETVHHYAKKMLLSVSQIRTIMEVSVQDNQRCLKALCYLNDMNIIHRDLKLENLVLQQPNKIETIKIIDFGLAIPCNSPIKQLCGTPGYIAPEMFIDKYPYTSKVDVFSLGAIFYKLLTRKPLFSGNTSDEILENNKRFKCNNHLKNCNDEIMDLLKSMLHKDPSKRITPEQALMHPFFGETQLGDLGIAEESPHEIVRTFPHIKPMQLTNSNDNLGDLKIPAIRGSQNSFENSLGSNYFPSFSELNKKSRNGSDHIIE